MITLLRYKTHQVSHLTQPGTSHFMLSPQDPASLPNRGQSPLVSGGEHPGGRPTKLNPEVIEKAKQYVYPVYVVDKESGATVPIDKGQSLPTVERLARTLGVSRSTVYVWAKESPEFSDILDDLLAEQADQLINNGLTGKFNSTITKLLLSGKHGYVEKSETDVTTKGESISTTPSDALRQEFAEFLKSKK